MDPYERKLRDMRSYLPFLTKMIEKLEKAGDASKEAQLSKMKSLKGILTDPDKKLRLETLSKCEDVLHKLYEKVEGVEVKKPPQKKEEAGSLSSYLQRLHENQYNEEDHRRVRNENQFNEEDRRHPIRNEGGGPPMRNDRRVPPPNPWMNDQQQPQGPWMRDQRNTQDRPFERPDPWVRGPRPLFDNNSWGPRPPQRFGGPRMPFDGGHPRMFGPPFDGPRRPFEGHRFDGPRFQGHDNRRSLLGAPPDRRVGLPDLMSGPIDRRGGPMDRMGGPMDRRVGPMDHMGGPMDQRGGPPDRMGGPMDRRGGMPDHMGGPMDRRGGLPDHIGGPMDRRGGPMAHMGGGPMDRRGGTPDHSSGPMDRRGGTPDRMSGLPDRRAGLPDPLSVGPPDRGRFPERGTSPADNRFGGPAGPVPWNQRLGPLKPPRDQLNKTDFVREWNRGVRGPVSDTPRSPGNTDLVDEPEEEETPKSPEPEDDLETPLSPPGGLETPLSPSQDESSSSAPDVTPASPDTGSSSKVLNPKMIPLERNHSSSSLSSGGTGEVKKMKELVLESPASPPASPPSEETGQSKTLPAPIPVTGPDQKTLESPASPSGDSPKQSRPTTLPQPRPLMHPSRPRPTLPEPHGPAWRQPNNQTLQPLPARLPLPHPSPSQNQPPIQHKMDPRRQRYPGPPSVLPTPHGPAGPPHGPPHRPPGPHHGPPPHRMPGGLGPQRHAPPLTYGEYRKQREEAMKRHQSLPPHQKQKSQQQPHQRPPQVMSRRDPRRPPRADEKPKDPSTSHSFGVSTEKSKGPEDPVGSLSKFKIPKKKRPEAEQANVVEAKPIIEKEPEPISDHHRPSLDESDSEPELRIAEPETASESEADTPVKAEPPEAKEEEEAKDSGQLTKAILQNIVASIDTEEASKLLERANRLISRGEGHKLSLKQLLGGDSDEEGGEEEKASTSSKVTKKASASKVTKVKTPKAKAKPSPSQGTRRSRRLQIEEPPPESEVKMEDDDDDESNQLVIDEEMPAASITNEDEDNDAPQPLESAVPVQEVKAKGRGRGRPRGSRGRGRGGRGGGRIQDDSVSSSTTPQCSEADMRLDEAIKEENEDQEDVTDVVPKQSRSKGSKSKTWFPGVRDTRSNVSGKKHVFETTGHEVQVKKEPKDPDLKVFLGSEDQNSVLDSEETLELFRSKKATVDPQLSEAFKQRLSKVTGIFNKVKALSKIHSKMENEDKKEPFTTKKESDTLSETELEEKPVEIVVTEKPEVYEQKMSDVIQKLSDVVQQQQQQHTEEETEEIETPFLDLVKSMVTNKTSDTMAENGSDFLTFELTRSEVRGLDSLSKCSANHKAAVPYADMLRPVGLKHLFKCMAYDCAFTSDNAAKFKMHLDEKKKSRKGWLKCAYCLRKLANSGFLVSHIVKDHGTCGYQCPYCFHRDTSLISLYMHQLNCHPEQAGQFIGCKSLPNNSNSNSTLPPWSAALQKPFRCKENQCSYETSDPGELSNHLFLDHIKAKAYEDYQCAQCLNTFDTASRYIIHSRTVHRKKSVNCIVRKIEHELQHENLEEESFEEEKMEEIEVESKMEEDTGLIGKSLFRCGNSECEFSAEDVSEFRDHVAICEYSVDAVYLRCYHCQKQLKHVATLLDHLKNHGLKRYMCSLCVAFKNAVPLNVRNHMRIIHRVNQTKLVPVDSMKTNPEKDYFVVMPKNALPKGIRQSTAGGKSKDTFAPDEWTDIPRIAMFRQLIRCSLCDFVTKVRLNMVKHLQLHLKCKGVVQENKEEDEGEQASYNIPFITPINPAENTDGSSFSKMTPLLDTSEEERAKRPMPDEDLAQMPCFVAENRRFACCDLDCRYCTIDEVMLAYHIRALHMDLDDMYKCPHCPDVTIPMDELDFHLRCHGDLLFKCGHCLYYHWQKRTAEKHVSEEHPGHKQFVRDVRLESEQIKKAKLSELAQTKKKDSKKLIFPNPVLYQPYKCGLCDIAQETIEGIRDHCLSVHELKHQYKCSFCDLSSDSKATVEAHCEESHVQVVNSHSMMRIFYVDPNNDLNNLGLEEKREPLWRRDMPGLKHIRGILYEEYPDYNTTTTTTTVAENEEVKSENLNQSILGENAADKNLKQNNSDKDEDNFPIKCRECGLQKKTIKGLKMHIKLLHLRTGKFLCRRCHFSANMLNSINTHYKIKHPDISEADFEEQKDKRIAFSHDFWKGQWNIPTLQERKAMVASKGQERPMEVEMEVRKRKSEGFKLPKAKRGKKAKKKPLDVVTPEKVDLVVSEVVSPFMVRNAMEISPFEQTQSYKCQYCPKRSQSLDRIERHLKADHVNRLEEECGYKVLTRDQVVDLLTVNPVASSVEGAAQDFICFYCEDVVGSIHDVKSHFANEHEANTFKVKRVQDGKKLITGYLECQVCGYLSAGFDRSKQKVHFHEEHPFEATVNASKYVSKSKPSLASQQPQLAEKFDPTKYIGMIMMCPKEDCNFDATSNAAMNAHLRKHTQTFKCGHCGKTHPNSSEFHRHSAMMHGNKIPDLVKDPEAEAEFEALRGLVEAGLQKAFEEVQLKKASKRKVTARKSTSKALVQFKSSVGKSNTARKSTGGLNRAEFSFYGVDQEPVNFNAISTRMSIGGMEITLNASKMAGLVNLTPTISIKDCEKKPSSFMTN